MDNIQITYKGKIYSGTFEIKGQYGCCLSQQKKERNPCYGESKEYKSK